MIYRSSIDAAMEREIADTRRAVKKAAQQSKESARHFPQHAKVRKSYDDEVVDYYSE